MVWALFRVSAGEWVGVIGVQSVYGRFVRVFDRQYLMMQFDEELAMITFCI